MPALIAFRPADVRDVDAIAAIFSPSIRLLTFLPGFHTHAEERWFIEHVLLVECAVTVAEIDGEIISFIARDGPEVRLLHTHPDHIGRGAGALLLNHAKTCGERRLELNCFQANTGARRFYERHGFRAIAFTDGRDNEEKTPDVRYRWDG